MKGVQLGPKHPDYGKPLDYLPPVKPKSEHRPRPGRPIRQLPPHIKTLLRVHRRTGRAS